MDALAGGSRHWQKIGQPGYARPPVGVVVHPVTPAWNRQQSPPCPGHWASPSFSSRGVTGMSARTPRWLSTSHNVWFLGRVMARRLIQVRGDPGRAGGSRGPTSPASGGTLRRWPRGAPWRWLAADTGQEKAIWLLICDPITATIRAYAGCRRFWVAPDRRKPRKPLAIAGGFVRLACRLRNACGSATGLVP